VELTLLALDGIARLELPVLVLTVIGLVEDHVDGFVDASTFSSSSAT